MHKIILCATIALFLSACDNDTTEVKNMKTGMPVTTQLINSLNKDQAEEITGDDYIFLGIYYEQNPELRPIIKEYIISDDMIDTVEMLSIENHLREIKIKKRNVLRDGYKSKLIDKIKQETNEHE